MTLLSGQEAVAQPSSPYIKEITAQNFMQEVVQASVQLPVLVYFTASWCGPCKQFGPLLEKVVTEAKGKIRLARVDVDKNPQIAQQFRVQSVPMVYVFFQGQPLDAFAGALPESQLKQLVAQLLNATPEHAQIMVSVEEAKKLLQEGKAEEAAQHFSALLEQEPDNIDALSGLAACYVMAGELEQAQAVLDTVPEASQKHEAVLSAKTALTLAQNAPKAGVLEALHAKIAANADDHEARCELAGALFAAGRQEEAIAELLTVITRDRNWNEGAARTQLLSFFEALGHTHPLTMQGRRKLSTLLFS